MRHAQTILTRPDVCCGFCGKAASPIGYLPPRGKKIRCLECWNRQATGKK